MKTLVYPVALEVGEPSEAVGVVVPDLPGCYSVGDNIEDALKNAVEAISAHIELLIDEGEQIPEKRSLDAHRASPDFQDPCWIWKSVEVEIA